MRSMGVMPPLLLLLAPAAAEAHGFGQRFDLPLPLWLWVTGAAATLVLTFAALALFAAQHEFRGFTRSADLLRRPWVRRLAHPLALLLRVLACTLFVLALATGLFGSGDPYRNLIVTLVWVIWWVGLAFVCALVGDVWEVADPLRTLYLAAVRLLRLRRDSLALPWPAWLGAWPAVALFIAFAWAELVWHGKDQPRALVWALLAYALIAWAGMALFGVQAWRDRGDAFALAFRVLGRFAPLGVRSSAPGRPAELKLRPYAAGLLEDDAAARVPVSVAVFVLAMLATVSFDGFHQTPLMAAIETAAQSSRTVAEWLFDLSRFGLDETQILTTVLLVGSVLGFVLIFRLFAGRDGAAMVWSLVPIAVAYHLSHYLTLLLTTGQFIVPLASDPFGFGWNLFGTRGFEVDLGLVSPYVYWYGSVLLVVAGHVLAVVVAHVEARRRLGAHRAAVASQLPMLVLMVAYTSLSLWIMAQPIVG